VIRSSSGRTVARRTLIGALALLLPVIAGCEAGNNAPTLEFHPASAGATTEINGIEISDAFVLGAPGGAPVPTGSSASMFMSLYNNGGGDDHLVSASAPGWATSVHLSGGTVSLPAYSLVDLSGPEPSVVLSDLTKPLDGGAAVPVTLDFAHAGSVTLDVPVEPMSDYYSTYSPPPPTPTPSATATPKAAKKAAKKASATASATPTS
jgi:copper(I)-binding protein